MKYNIIRNAIIGIAFYVLISYNPSIIIYIPLFIATVLFIMVAKKVQQDKEYSTLKKSLIITSYLIASLIFYSLILINSTLSLLALAILAITYQLYYKEKTPEHFRTFCYNSSLTFLVCQMDFITAGVIFSSSIYAYVYFALIITIVVIYNIEDSYEHSLHNINSFEKYYADFNINYIFFFLGLISRSDTFPKSLEQIKWHNIILGIIIGAASLWMASILLGLAYGYHLVACVSSIPNATSFILVMVMTPFQTYYEEYLFRHKLTEKIINKYNSYRGQKNTELEKYPYLSYAINSVFFATELEKDSYLIYAINSVFFALAHIASPGRNFSIIQCLLTTLPAGILFQKIYIDHGIEASTGIHAGHNILIMLDMFPVFIETSAYISLTHFMALMVISLSAELLIALLISHYTLPPITAEKEPKGSISLYRSTQLYYEKAADNITYYMNRLAQCL